MVQTVSLSNQRRSLTSQTDGQFKSMVTGPQHRILDTGAEVWSRNSKNVKGRNSPPDRNFFFLRGAKAPQWTRASWLSRFLDYKQRRTTVATTPLDEWSARRRDLYLTTHNTTDINAPSPPVGFEPTISAGERPQTYALDRAATGTG